MRRFVLLLTAHCSLLTVCAQIAQIPWDVQQDRPVAHDVYIWQGETVDLLPRLVQGISPVAVTNAPIEFRYREASLPTNTYRIVTAAANTNSGVLSVRWLPDYDAGAAWYDYQIIVGSNAANPRCFGRILMRTTIGWPASTNPPPPVTQYPTRTEFQAASNALAAALHDVYSVSDAAARQAESNRVAIAAIPPQSSDAYRLVNSNATRWIDGTGTVGAVCPATNYLRGFVVTNIAGNATNSIGLAVGDCWTFYRMVTNANGSTNRYEYTSPEKKTLFWAASPQTWFVSVRMFDSESGPFYSFYSPAGSYSNTDFTVADYLGGTISMAETNVPSVSVVTGAVDRVAFKSDLVTLTNGLVTADQVYASKELHADNFTNLIWRTVWSNGWCWAVAHTNTP